MSKVTDEQLYCCVDLEFTGFDPSRDQILEIGFAFFKVTKKGLEVVEKWDQVFKPSIEVHPKILGLTGITQEELDAAPEFNEHREFLQEKLGNAIIVGHNPVMDVKFLESYGIKLSGQVVDTLELVQFLLPTHHSYNLENLVHYFGVKHAKSHRALGDAVSTVTVLENLIRIYQQFPDELKKELQAVIDRGEFLWQPLFIQNFPVKKIQGNDSLKAKKVPKLTPLKIGDGLITIDPTPANHEVRVALGLQKQSKDFVLAVSDAQTVMKLWRDDLVHGVFLSEDTFSEKAFREFLKNSNTNEELRFCLKIIVWLHTNWQTEVVFDLNISFFGGQYRSFITGGKPRIVTDKLLCVDYSTLQNLKLKNYKLVVCDIQNFEKYMSAGFGMRMSWNSVIYLLKLLYNPETELGNLKIKDEVITALIGTDLFFGLVFMLLQKAYPRNDFVTIGEISENHPELLNRLERAAANLNDKISIIKKKDRNSNLNVVSNFLESFFEPVAKRVKWINIDEKNLAFHDRPIEIKQNVQGILKNFSSVHFTETLSNKELLSYLVDRLGLSTDISELPNKLIPNDISLSTINEVITDDQLLSITKEVKLPLIIIFPALPQIKDFYNANYLEIKKNAALFAQGYSGGGNKMFRNFSINENSILLATADFIGKQNYKISAQRIVFTKLPSVDDTHPYIAALLNHWKKDYPDLKALFAFEKIASSLKKLKLNHSVTVVIYNSDQKNIFVDKVR